MAGIIENPHEEIGGNSDNSQQGKIYKENQSDEASSGQEPDLKTSF